jgi:type I restriction enzyme S subunit
MNNISLADLRQFVIPVPPRQEQEEIVSRARKLFAMADSIESRLARVVRHATAAPEAILTQAFVGELVPTEAELARAEGRSYESAEELLPRLRAERAAIGTTTSVSRRSRPAKARGPSTRRRTR